MTNQTHFGKGDNHIGDKHIYQSTSPKLIMGLVTVFLIALIAVLYFFLAPKKEINTIWETGKAWEETDTSFKVLILPFEVMCKGTDGYIDVGAFLQGRLAFLNKEYQLNISPKYLEGLPISANFDTDTIQSIQKKFGADLIVFGNYLANNCTSTSEDEYCYRWITDDKWGFVDSISNNLNYQYQNSSINKILNGDLQSKTDFIIYWIAAMTAFNQREFDKSEVLLNYVLDNLEGHRPYIYSLLGHGAMQQGKVKKAVHYSELGLETSETALDSVYAINDLYLRYAFQGKYSEGRNYLVPLLEVISRLEGYQFCEVSSFIFSTIYQGIKDNQNDSADLVAGLEAYWYQVLEQCGQSIEQFPIFQELVTMVQTGDFSNMNSAFADKFFEILLNGQENMDPVTISMIFTLMGDFYGLLLNDYEALHQSQKDMVAHYQHSHAYSELDRSGNLAYTYSQMIYTANQLRLYDTAQLYRTEAEKFKLRLPQLDPFLELLLNSNNITLQGTICNFAEALPLQLKQTAMANSFLEEQLLNNIIADQANTLRLYLDTGDFDGANQLLKELEKVWNNIDTSELAYEGLINQLAYLNLLSAISQFYGYVDNLEECLKYNLLQLSVAVHLPASYDYHKSMIYGSCAILSSELDKCNEAQTFADSSFALAKNIPDYQFQVNVGAAYAKGLAEKCNGNAKAAIDWINKGINAFNPKVQMNCFDDYFKANGFNTLSEIYFEQKEDKLAIKYNQMAYELIKDLPMPHSPIHKEVLATRQKLKNNNLLPLLN